MSDQLGKVVTAEEVRGDPELARINAALENARERLTAGVARFDRALSRMGDEKPAELKSPEAAPDPAVPHGHLPHANHLILAIADLCDELHQQCDRLDRLA